MRVPSATSTGVRALVIAIVLYLSLSAWVVHARGYLDPERHSYDAAHYEAMTKQWLDTGVFGYYALETPGEADAKVGWGYPSFLAPFYYLDGHTDPLEPGGPYVAIFVAQLLVGVLGLWATWVFARAALGARAAAVAAVVLAITQGISGQAGLLLLHTLSTALFSGFMALWAVSLLKGKSWIAWLAGLLFSASLLTRPSMLLPGLVLIALGISMTLRPDWRLRFAAVGGTATLVVPWMIRNWIVLGSPRFTTGRDDPVLAGVDPWFRTLGEKYRYYGPSYERYFDLAEQGGDLPSKGEYARRVLIDGIKHRPVETLTWFTLGKLQEYLYASKLAQNVTDALVGVWTPLYNSAAMLGAFLAPWYRDLLPTVAALAVGVAQMLLVVPESRYMYDLSPLMAVCASALVIAAIDGARAVRVAAVPAEAVTPED